MAIELEAKDLHTELQASQRQTIRYLGDYRGALAKLGGPEFAGGAGATAWDPENFDLQLLAIYAPQVLWGVPRVRIKTPRFGPQRVLAKKLELFTNQWIRTTQDDETNEVWLCDMMTRWAIAMTSSQPWPSLADYDDPPKLPSVSRISPEDFIWDSGARTKGQCRLLGHGNIYDRKELIEHAHNHPEEGWNIALLESKANKTTTLRPGKPDVPERDEVKIWSMWLPNKKLEHAPGPRQGFNGVLVALLDGQEDQFVREKRMAFGPPSGPDRKSVV